MICYGMNECNIIKQTKQLNVRIDIGKRNILKFIL